MKKLIQKVAVLAIICAVTGSGFAQKSGDKGRPPRDPAKVVAPDKGSTPPPPQNSNRPRPTDDKKKH